MLKGKLGGYAQLAHPLAQVEAAYDFCGRVQAFVSDEWEMLYTDAPPDDEALEDAEPANLLDELAKLGMRFELAGHVDEQDDPFDGYWAAKYDGSSFGALLHGWAHDVLDATELDWRAFEPALFSSDLIFIPDDSAAASKAYFLLLDARREDVAKRVSAFESKRRRLSARETASWSALFRGEGPKANGRAMADKIACCIRDARKPLTADDVATRIRHKNIRSVLAALHQMVAYKKPKRLAGWIVRNDDGRYVWAGS